MNKAGRGKISLVLVVLIVAFISVTPAYSDVIYSSYGAGSTYDTSQAVDITTAQYWAFSFTPTVSARLDKITYTVSAAAQYTSITLLLMKTQAGLPHGQLIGIYGTVNNTSPQTFEMGMSSYNIILSQGTQYWLAMEELLAGTLHWSYGLDEPAPIVAAQGIFNTNTKLVSWSLAKSEHAGAFSIEGTPLNSVPEPGALWLLGCGLLGLFGIGRKMNE
jgi:hypothetical protein